MHTQLSYSAQSRAALDAPVQYSRVVLLVYTSVSCPVLFLPFSLLGGGLNVLIMIITNYDAVLPYRYERKEGRKERR